MEHSGFSIETVKATLKYLEAGGVPALVRPPSRDYSDIARVLDIGADGVVLPLVSTPAEARRIVDCVKYPPVGHRGIGLGLAHDRYRPGVPAEKLKAANQETLVVMQIETEEGAAKVDAIAAVDGVDGLWIGHYDLSASLGIPGQFSHAKFVAAVDATIAACRKHKRSLGILVGSVDDGVKSLKRGFNLLCYSSDAWLFRDALGAGIAGLRAAGTDGPNTRKARGKG
jgi:2-dehydro-3-deoxyglucarate aldolase/4-hydroxy-2-oxoheptanedioate aldolase